MPPILKKSVLSTKSTRNKIKSLGRPGSKPQDLSRRYDTTQLRETGHGTRVHRDYAAHFFRWGWASRFVKSKETKILDIGCGQDFPLIKVLAGSLSTVPGSYVGIDLNKLNKKPNVNWVTAILDKFDFIENGWKKIKRNYGQFDLIVCFEVIEHMHVIDGKRLLKGMKECLTNNGKILLSTPVYNKKRMAANHLHEWLISELEHEIINAGLSIETRFGTFASWHDIRKVCTLTEKCLLDEVGKFYGGDVLACFLAPKYPNASRNNAWILTKKEQ